MPPDQETLEGLFVAACHAELAALKPGNVHIHNANHRMTMDDFERSAAVAAPPYRQAWRTGRRPH